MSETPQGTWLGGVRKGSLWLSYAVSLLEIEKFDLRWSPKTETDFFGEEQWGKLERRKMKKISLRQNERESTLIWG